MAHHHDHEGKKNKLSDFILLSEDGEIQEHVVSATINDVKLTARKMADVKAQSFTIYKAVAKTTFKQVARTERV